MIEESEHRDWINEYPTLKQVNPANPFTVPFGYFDEMEGQVMDDINLLNLIPDKGNGGFTAPSSTYFDELTQNIESRIAVNNLIANGKGFTVPYGYFNELSSNIQIRIAMEQVLNKDKGFTVPEGYFDELSAKIQSRIIVEDTVDADKGFTVPEGYFDELAANIQNRIAIEEVLNTDNSFSVPDGYFDKLTSKIHSLVAVEEAVNSDKGFTLPEGYFEELSQNIEARVNIEKALSDEEGFTIPEGYFEGLESRILAQTVENKTSTRVNQDRNVVRKLWATAAFKYATAACFSLFVGAAIYISEFNETAIHDRSDVHKAISKLSISDMATYLEINGDAPTIMENADPNKINTSAADDSDDIDMN